MDEDNTIGSEGLGRLAEYLKINNCSLQFLDLEGNFDSKDNSSTQLTQKETSLEILEHKF